MFKAILKSVPSWWRGGPGAVGTSSSNLFSLMVEPRDRHGGFFRATIVFATLLIVPSLGLFAAIDALPALAVHKKLRNDEGRAGESRSRKAT